MANPLAWLLGGNDKQMAATKYAGRESATDRAARKRAERGSMGTPHHTARQAANQGEDYRLGRKTPKPRRFTRGG